jgi:hypothetical protein
MSKWTAKFGPWRLCHTEKHMDYTAARKREIELKRQKGGSGFYRSIGRTFADLTRNSSPPDS